MEKETMVTKAQTRRRDEAIAQKERQKNYEDFNSEELDSISRIGTTTAFDGSNLPMITLHQIPVIMRADADQNSARVIMETKVI